MAEPALEKPNFTVSLDSKYQLLRIIWEGSVSEKELVAGYEHALLLLKGNPVKYILIDISRRKLNITGNPDPVFGRLFKEALQIIGQRLFLAMVLSIEEYFLSSEASRFGNLKDADNKFVIVENFMNRQDAEAWLMTAE